MPGMQQSRVSFRILLLGKLTFRRLGTHGDGKTSICAAPILLNRSHQRFIINGQINLDSGVRLLDCPVNSEEGILQIRTHTINHLDIICGLFNPLGLSIKTCPVCEAFLEAFELTQTTTQTAGHRQPSRYCLFCHNTFFHCSGRLSFNLLGLKKDYSEYQIYFKGVILKEFLTRLTEKYINSMNEIIFFLKLVCAILVSFAVLQGIVAVLIIKALVGKIRELQTELKQRNEDARCNS